ncbi:oligosaccharide flippase family protein [Thermophilibacter sp.]
MSIAKNFFYNISYQILVLIVPLVTTPYLARMVGAEALGQYSYSYSVAYYFVLFAMLGVNNYGNRSIARVCGDRELVSRTFWSIFALQCSLAVLMLVLYVGYALCFEGASAIALAWVPYVISAAFDVNWFFFGLEEFRLTVVRNSIIKLLTFISIFVFVRGDYALIAYCLIMSASFLLSAIALWPALIHRVDWYLPSIQEVLAHLKPNALLFVPVVAVSLYAVLDKLMLGWWSTMEQVGYFDSALKIGTFAMTFIDALGTVMLPRAAALFAQGKRKMAEEHLELSIWFVLMLSFALCFGIAGVAPTFVPLYLGEGFEPCVLLSSIIVADMPFMALSNVLRTQYLIPLSRDREYTVSIIAGAISNILINLALIPALGATGAAIAAFAAEAVVCLVQCAYLKDEIPLMKWLKAPAYFLFAGTLMYLAVSFLGSQLDGSSISLLLEVVLGAGCYVALFLLWLLVVRKSVFGRRVLSLVSSMTREIAVRERG